MIVVHGYGGLMLLLIPCVWFSAVAVLSVQDHYNKKQVGSWIPAITFFLLVYGSMFYFVINTALAALLSTAITLILLFIAYRVDS